ncbi:MAG: GNAT family N-acetyltransferase [Candidatus Omnitrophica bacterium]|nr:GNAT family N-acetyltransferase [Candidatus Omnitrophota bacterium]
MGYSLRQFRSQDSQGVKDLILTILTREYPFDRSAYSDSDLDKIAETYSGHKDSFFVVEENGNIVGTVGIKEDSAEDALLRRLFVDPKHRKLGYGSELLEMAIKFARERGYERIFFRCTDRMAAAMKLCRSKGFKEKDSLEVSGFMIHRLELGL